MLSLSIKNRFSEMFKTYSMYAKPIEADGYMEKNGSIYINYSSILTRLIQEAGRYCESYASDLFIDWRTIDEQLEDGSIETESKLFGFRESGVDHTEFVYSRLYNSIRWGHYEYRSIWKLDIVVEDDDYYGKKISMSLIRVSRPYCQDLEDFFRTVKAEEKEEQEA